MRALRDQSFWFGLLGVTVGVVLTLAISGRAPSVSPNASAAEPGVPGVAPAAADAPRLIPFQAYLTDSGGRPANGQHAIEFRLYNRSGGCRSTPCGTSA